uniref:Mos1 transposase HTH domain-containing protein n=1 Tax=Acrobeloides nanus TaxID=290746 RepID=A0A914EHU1_9BILA
MTAYGSCREINEVFGDGTIDHRTCYEWFNRFKSGDTSLEDKEGRGRPVEIDFKALLEAVENDQGLTTRMLAEQFGVPL